ncbi:ANTAR domain-containing protein [Kineococcus sp. SYSU DK005]|uniref:ANTAR domain-containing protein n=1 Tax=Kineococcus sp. SYSU DK005 TaxID=3383126 RepID=UPI003D7E0EC2
MPRSEAGRLADAVREVLGPREERRGDGPGGADAALLRVVRAAGVVRVLVQLGWTPPPEVLVQLGAGVHPDAELPAGAAVVPSPHGEVGALRSLAEDLAVARAHGEAPAERGRDLVRRAREALARATAREAGGRAGARLADPGGGDLDGGELRERLERSERTVVQLRRALLERPVLEQAVGVLVREAAVGAEAAWQAMLDAARLSGAPARSVAEEVTARAARGEPLPAAVREALREAPQRRDPRPPHPRAGGGHG